MSLCRTEHPLDPQDRQTVENLLAFASTGTDYRVETTDVQAMRTATERMTRMPLMMQGDPTVTVTEASVGGVQGEWLQPEGCSTESVVVFVHGGGYVRGSLALARPSASRLAALSGCRVFAPSYRQGPEDPFPAAYEDILAVARGIGKEGWPFVLTGESSGGGLAIAAAMGVRNEKGPLPKGVAGFSPFLDLTLDGESWTFNEGKDVATRQMGESMIGLYMQGADRTDWRASPVFGQFTNLPPLYLAVGSHEGLLSEVLTTAENAASAGGDVTLDVFEGMPHGFTKYALKAADQATRNLARWIVGQMTE